MDKLKAQTVMKLKYLQSQLQSESEKMHEIVRRLNEGWCDPGAELAEKELTRTLLILDGHLSEINKKITVLEDDSFARKENTECLTIKNRETEK